MNTLYEKSIRTLELPRVLEMLAEEAVSEPAKEQALALRPAENIYDAKDWMAETTAAARLIAIKGSPSFSSVRDPGSALKRAEMGGALSMPTLLEIAALLTASRRIKAYLDDDTAVETCINKYFDQLQPDKYLEERITNSILNEDEMADAASPALADIRRKIRVANSRVRETLQRIITSPAHSKHLQEAIITQRSGRYVVPVRSEFKGEISGLVHDVSSSGSTFFIEPVQVVNLNNEIRELQANEKKEIERILAELSNEVAGSAGQIRHNYEMLVRLDLIFAKGKFSYKLHAAEPDFKEDGFAVSFRRARHPLLDKKTAVPVTVSLGESFDTLVVTGPNTGGKTVTLKTIGLLTLMASCGLHIPADDGSYVSLFNGIYADIGDEQSIEQSLSTFSSHMTNIVKILDEAGEGSMILFDELGAGTDPIEGAALAVSIILYARAAGARIAATTHYAELKEFALTTQGVENASCEFDVETLKPTFRLLIGVPGKSNAFAISKRLGLNEMVIASAQSLIDEESRKFEDVLANLEKERQRLEAESLEAEKLRREAEEEVRKARKFRSDAEKERSRARDRANREAQHIIAQAREEVDAILAEINELRRRQAEEDMTEELNRARSELKGRLNAMDDKLRPKQKKQRGKKPPRPLKAGDTVKLLNIGTTGTVLTPPDSSGNLTVQAGILKVSLKQDEVELVEYTPPADPVKAYVTTPKRELGTRKVSTELDLRGMTTDEALHDLEQFLDEAIMSNLNTVTIIHGKGTGALRAAVQQYLRGNRHVKSFRAGVFGEGEMGVTVVEL